MIYEDPAVMFEGVAENPDPVDMESYLVSFSTILNKLHLNLLYLINIILYVLLGKAFKFIFPSTIPYIVMNMKCSMQTD